MANIFIKTFGCSLNQSDSELMAGLLKKDGHKITGDDKESDIVIINSCTVKNEAENKLYKEIRRHKNKKIIIAGCVAQADKKTVESKLKNYSVLGTSQITKIGFAVKNTLLGNIVVLLDKEKIKRLNLPKVRKNEKIEIIPISEGCKGACTYCKTKQARGELLSYDRREIIKQAKDAVKQGTKQIWLTSQDTGAYGLDIKETLALLLDDILKIKGDFMVRLGMCNPNFALKYEKDLIRILKHKKMFRFIHLPLQSASDGVLKNMGRKYTEKEFTELVNNLKKNSPDLTFATDIIVGFPGETDEDFEKTLSLIWNLKPDIINISRFWKRPGTTAAKMKQIDSKTIKRRSIKLRELFHKISLEKNKEWVGWEGAAIVERSGKDKTLVARNFAYKPIVMRDDGQKLGEKINVKIISAAKWDLRGEIVKKNQILIN